MSAAGMNAVIAALAREGITTRTRHVRDGTVYVVTAIRVPDDPMGVIVLEAVADREFAGEARPLPAMFLRHPLRLEVKTRLRKA